MKKKILLIDESLTVQKVVALTLDKQRYELAFAKSRLEAMKAIAENLPDIILVSDQVGDLSVSSFPVEVEAWVGRSRKVPPVILIATNPSKELRGYAASLKKPFAPQLLAEIVREQTEALRNSEEPDEFEDQRLQKIFNDAFADESRLMAATLGEPPMTHSRTDGTKSSGIAEALWDKGQSVVPGRQVNVLDDLWGGGASKASQSPEKLEAQLESRLGDNLDAALDRVLTRLLPPLVERLVREKLDQLLNEDSKFVEFKP